MAGESSWAHPHLCSFKFTEWIPIKKYVLDAFSMAGLASPFVLYTSQSP
jgi:hypothetical protein